MYALANLIDTAVSIYLTLLFAAVILTWLVQFNVVNPRQPLVHTIGTFLYRITEPALAPIRRIMPNLGGIDISPVILILLIHFARNLIVYDLLLPMAYRNEMQIVPGG
ncbi:MAG TPA: YggT family protein [Geminicoccus sp.]|jgi:YggT family protein|uniref:YggT family protein n=1 Tax=Geminicoccus sp. TaxID=2024832 RepID=UPI002CB049F5|nr:YggT family protein [Geminicoccus sp.]HWL67382.1 YggT family protein [Geminicoccus sp.]